MEIIISTLMLFQSNFSARGPTAGNADWYDDLRLTRPGMVFRVLFNPLFLLPELVDGIGKYQFEK